MNGLVTLSAVGCLIGAAALVSLAILLLVDGRFFAALGLAVLAFIAVLLQTALVT